MTYISRAFASSGVRKSVFICLYLLLALVLFRDKAFYLALSVLVIGGAFWHVLTRLQQSAGGKIPFGWVECLLLGASTLIALLLAEVGLRIYTNNAAAPWAEVPEDWAFVPHAERIFTPRPHLENEYIVNLGYEKRALRIPYSLSSLGLRNAEIEPKAPDSIRVLLLGDSFTQGWGQDADTQLSAVLQQLVNETTPDLHIEIINAGVSGYAPWQARLMFLELQPIIAADFVYLQVFPTNDISETLAREKKHLRAYSPLALYNFVQFTNQGQWQIKVHRYLWRNLRLYQLIESATGNKGLAIRVLNQLRISRRAEIFHPPPSVDRPYSLEVNLAEYYPELDEGWRQFKADILELQRECIASNVHFVTYALPSCLSIGSAAQWQTRSSGYGVDYIQGKEVQLAEEFFREKGLPYVSVFDYMQAAPNRDDLYYFYDGHLTPTGASFVAEILAWDVRERVRALQYHPAP